MNPAYRLLVGICGYLVLGPVCGISVEAQQTLRWKFQPGMQYQVSFDQTTLSKTQADQESIQVRLHMGMAMQWKVTQVDNAGTATMEQAFTRIRLELENPGVEQVSYDSSSRSKPVGEAAQIAVALGPVIGKIFRVRMTARGMVQEVIASPEMQAALKRIPRESRLKDVFTREGLMQTLRQSHGVLPAKAVQLGDQWEAVETVATPLGDLKTKTRYRYGKNAEDAGAAAAQIQVHGQIELVPAKDKKTTRNHLRIESQEIAGEILFASIQGHLLRSEINQQMVTQSRYRDLQLTSRVTSRLETTVRRGK
ncbi:MAG: DUF6263 family protein [Planctomycetota bacterium]|nr:DUF6263 family protein [Planctomycetota bacterium]